MKSSKMDNASSHGEGIESQPSCPMGYGTKSKFLVNPRNMMPEISTTPESPEQTASLSQAREISSIPKTGSAACWQYPSPQMFYNALIRREKEAESDSMDAVVHVHNFVNEETWKKILEFEKLHYASCPTPSLQRFIGKSEELSPQAFFKQIYLGRPFDRHDWFVDRCGQKTVRYIIDYYDAPSADGFDVQIDVRPAADTLDNVWDRLRVSFRSLLGM